MLNKIFMKNIFKKVTLIIKDVLIILANERLTFANKVNLLFNYIKVRILLFLDGRIINVKKLRFLGFTVDIVSMNEFFILVQEIFIREVYYFNFNIDNPVIFDAGSNIGMSVLYFKYLYPNSFIYAFEPSPKTFEILQYNTSENNLKNVELFNVGLSDIKSNADFFVKESMSLANTLVVEERREGEMIEVRVDCLSHYIESEIDILKLDVQLSEYKVLHDLDISGKLNFINTIHMEIHYLPEYKDNEMSSILSILEKNNFIYHMELNEIKSDNFATYTLKAFKK